MANLSCNSSEKSPTYMQQLLNVYSLLSSIECHYRFHWVRDINVDIFHVHTVHLDKYQSFFTNRCAIG